MLRVDGHGSIAAYFQCYLENILEVFPGKDLNWQTQITKSFRDGSI